MCSFTHSYYIVIVVPLGNSNKLPKDKTPDDFFNEVRRRRDLQTGAEAPYIAAKFGPFELPKRFNVGDKNFENRYGYYNKELTKGSYYTMFVRAYVKNNKGVGRLYVRQCRLGSLYCQPTPPLRNILPFRILLSYCITRRVKREDSPSTNLVWFPVPEVTANHCGVRLMLFLFLSRRIFSRHLSRFSPFKHFEISIREYCQRVVESFLGPVYLEVGDPR